MRSTSCWTVPRQLFADVQNIHRNLFACDFGPSILDKIFAIKIIFFHNEHSESILKRDLLDIPRLTD